MNHSISRLPTEDEIEEEANSRQYLMKNFRIAKCEYARFLLLSAMFGIIGFIYSYMRIIKDTYVMVRQDPNCILYIKIFYILPLSFAVVFLINYMLTKRSLSQIFSLFSIGFMCLFAFFGAFIVFEDRILSTHTSTIRNQMDLYFFETRGLGKYRSFVLTFSEPLATLIYITAELWGSIMLSYLFLSFLNEVCTRKQHKRFLPALFVVANLSLLLSAVVTTFFFRIRERLTYEQNIIFMASIFFVEAFLTFGLLMCKYLLERKAMSSPLFRAQEIPDGSTVVNLRDEQPVSRAEQPRSRQSAPAKGKADVGFAEGLEIMSRSKFLLAMCTIVFFYSVTYNILETVYKNGIKRGAESLGKEKGAYSGRFNNIDQYLTAITVIILNMTPFSNLTDWTSWLTVALISPIITAMSSFFILGMASYNSGTEETTFSAVNKFFGGMKNNIVMENYLGMVFLSAMKIFKFTAFDVTKERISMRIEDRYRPKFKSIFDGIFNKFGKSFGALYGIVAGVALSEIDIRGMSPVTAVLVCGFLSLWIGALFYLSRSYERALLHGGKVDIDLAEEEDVKNKEEKKMFVMGAAQQEMVTVGSK